MPPDLPLGQMKVARNSYQFSMRRRFQPIEHYHSSGGGGEDTPLRRILSSLKGTKRPFEGKEPAPKKGGKPQPSGLPIGAILAAAGAAILLFLFFILWTVLVATAPQAAPTPPMPKLNFSASLISNIDDKGVLSFGSTDKPAYQPYFSTELYSANASEANISAALYATQPSRQIFILRHPRRWADSYGPFHSELLRILSENGYAMSEISPEMISAMPTGSTLIIPTGFLPAFLLDDARAGSPQFPPGAQSPTPLLLSLASGGTTVIFIGQPFTTVLDGESQVPPATGKLERLGIKFDEKNKPSPSSQFDLSKPLYSAQGASRDIYSTLLWGPISDFAIGSGHLLLIPETLDGGWDKDGTRAARDISRLVMEEPGRQKLSTASYSLSNINETYNGRTYLFFSPSAADSGYVRARYTIADRRGVVRSWFEDFFIRKEPLGELYFDGEPALAPKFLGGGSADIFVGLREPTCTKVKIYFQLVKDREVVEFHDLESGLTQPCGKKTDFIKSNLETDLLPGAYILRMADDNGKVYAAARVVVDGIGVSGPDKAACGAFCAFRDNEFNFSFFMRGQPVSVQYVRVWSNSSVPEEFRDKSVISYKPKYEFKGSPEGAPHTFILDLGGGYTQSYTIAKVVTRWFWDDLRVQVLGVVALLVGFVGYMVRRPEKALLSLDVPDFAPLSVRKIPMPSSAVLSLFEQINRDYAWECMPLKVEEIKNGFVKMNWQGKPIAIGDYNLERILGRLEELGKVESSLGYYGLSKWAAQSGHSARARAIFRRIRDLCVTNAIRFSKLGALPYCDLKIVVGQGEYFLHFFLGNYGVMSRALETVPLGRSWILFTENFEREKFRSRLQSSESAPIALKMEMYNKRARLVTLDELPDLLKSLKVEMS